MGRRCVEIVIELFHVFAVISFKRAYAEEALFQNWIFAVPKRGGKEENLKAVGNPRNPILAPPVCPVAGMIVREVSPGIAIFAIVLSNGAPPPFRDVRT